MLKIIEPEAQYMASYCEAYEESLKYENLGAELDDPDSCDLIQKYDDLRNERNLPEGFVGSEEYWLVDDERDRFLGRLSIRRRLTPALEQFGGHIGYVVRCDEWNKGYGTSMLHWGLHRAKDIGVDTALVTCDYDNVASYRVMEKNGMMLKDVIQIPGREQRTRRYEKKL